MSTEKTSFHIQHVARPEHVRAILSATSATEPLDADSLHNRLTGSGYEVVLNGVRRSLSLGTKLDLFEKSGRSRYTLTTRGRACRSLALYRPEVFWDVMHFLLFDTWESNGHQDHWSWSYAKVCEFLWHDRPAIKNRKALFGQLSAEAARDFPDFEPVVGTETVYAVTNWLRQLSPPFFVVEDDELKATQERQWFSAELALLAVSYLHSSRGIAVRTPILLDRPTMKFLCPLCLASADRILAMIEIASQTFPALEIGAGEWGSSVVLHQRVDIPFLT